MLKQLSEDLMQQVNRQAGQTQRGNAATPPDMSQPAHKLSAAEAGEETGA